MLLFRTLLALAGAFSGLSCSSTPKGVHTIQELVPQSLRVRRPIAPAADPKAIPGGQDYTSRPAPNEHFDCERVESLFNEMNLESIRACINSVKVYSSTLYALHREPMPYLALDDPEDEDLPKCLGEVLKRIPVPREIVFQAPVKGTLYCYAAGVNLEKGKILESKVPTGQFRVRVVLPLDEELQNDEETIRLLGGWALTPFWEESMKARIVPDHLCEKCLGKGQLISEEPPNPKQTWP